MTRCCGVFPVICPTREPGVGLAPACWPDQKPVRVLERVTRHRSAAAVSTQTDTGSCPPNAWAGGQTTDARRSAGLHDWCRPAPRLARAHESLQGSLSTCCATAPTVSDRAELPGH